GVASAPAPTASAIIAAGSLAAAGSSPRRDSCPPPTITGVLGSRDVAAVTGGRLTTLPDPDGAPSPSPSPRLGPLPQSAPVDSTHRRPLRLHRQHLPLAHGRRPPASPAGRDRR